MSKLFISYRRDYTADICGRLYDKLAPRFGAENIFKDVDSIPLGADFRQVLRESMAECVAMLVVIGRNWLTVTDSAGRQRLENPNDFVRIEVEAALERNIPVIPVLVQNAAMPQEDELPASLAPLAYRQSLDVRGDPHFHRDADQLLDRLVRLLPALPTWPATPSQNVLLPPPLSPELFPKRLAALGFTAATGDGVAYILPPLCPVPAGPFLMGSDKRRDSYANDEMPQHTVNLSTYQIAQFPVTVTEYACAVRAGAVRQPVQSGNVTWQQQLTQLDHPVVCITWEDAVVYARWLAERSGQLWRLPSEAEWEKAARWDPERQISRLYPWGDVFDETRCNTQEGSNKTTTPVGTYPNGTSPCGAQDMMGNAWEWTSSLYKSYPYNASDGREDTNSTENRVRRGGSWNEGVWNAHAACREHFRPVLFILNVGFRLVLAA